MPKSGEGGFWDKVTLKRSRGVKYRGTNECSKKKRGEFLFIFEARIFWIEDVETLL